MLPIAMRSGGTAAAELDRAPRERTSGSHESPGPHRTLGYHNQRLGKRGEDLAVAHLERAGLRVLARNWRCESGEIDIVVADRSEIVGCEVKTRSRQTYGPPHEGVDERKLARLHRLIHRWAQLHGHRPDSVRVDVIGVLLTPEREPLIEHLVRVC